MRQVVRRRPPGLAFYTTALVVSGFATYGLLRSRSGVHVGQQRLGARDLVANDLECRFVHNADDMCAFVRTNCPDEEAGLISYLQFYYCSLASTKPIAFAILVTWISLLFSTIGIAASDFLCINLSTIATILGMSESLTGVTFLAFGNGSPDVFSTFAAMSSNSGSLAIGELMGAAGFITAVVAGSMALVKPFQVARKSFVRDVGFFVAAASFSLSFLADGQLRLWECAAMIGFYVFYVIFVVSWHWWIGRRRKRRLREAAARLHHHIPDSQELEIPEIEEDEEARPASERTNLLRPSSGDDWAYPDAPVTPTWKIEDIDDDDETRDRYLAELRSGMRVSRHNRRERRNTITPIRPSLIGALEFRSVLNSLEKRGTGSSPIHLRRYSDDPLVQAAGNLSAVSQPELPQENGPGPGLQHDVSTAGRARAVSANDAVGLRLDASILDIPDLVPETAVSSGEPSISSGPPSAQLGLSVPGASPQLFVSPPVSSLSSESVTPQPHGQSGQYLAPPESYFHRPNYNEPHRVHDRSPAVSPRLVPRLEVPKIQVPQQSRRSPSVEFSFPQFTDSPLVVTPASSRPSSIRLPDSSLPSDSDRRQSLASICQFEDDENMRTFVWWPYNYLPPPQIIASTLFPTVYGWRSKSILEKLLGIVTVPSVFLLTITLPVVEYGGSDLPESDTGLPSPSRGSRSRSSTGVWLTPSSPSIPTIETSTHAPLHPHKITPARQDSDALRLVNNNVSEMPCPKEWNRWLVFLQIFTAPLFTVFIIWANLEDHSKKLLVLLFLSSLIFSLLCLLILLATTTSDHEPKFRPFFCFLGFAVAVAWISTIAGEVVGVLKTLGVILDISDAILGLTIFAVGNSLGDLVADITVARLGFPVMALSACFGGPMLNILLGIGISGLYIMITDGEHRHHKHPENHVIYEPYEIEVSVNLIISGITLLVTLVGLLIAVPLNGWRMDRKIGCGLILLWSLSTIGNVVFEVTGNGGGSVDSF